MVRGWGFICHTKAAEVALANWLLLICQLEFRNLFVRVNSAQCQTVILCERQNKIKFFFLNPNYVKNIGGLWSHDPPLNP